MSAIEATSASRFSQFMVSSRRSGPLDEAEPQERDHGQGHDDGDDDEIHGYLLAAQSMGRLGVVLCATVAGRR